LRAFFASLVSSWESSWIAVEFRKPKLAGVVEAGIAFLSQEIFQYVGSSPDQKKDDALHFQPRPEDRHHGIR
jgi:hypothetical protein